MSNETITITIQASEFDAVYWRLLRGAYADTPTGEVLWGVVQRMESLYWHDGEPKRDTVGHIRGRCERGLDQHATEWSFGGVWA